LANSRHKKWKIRKKWGRGRGVKKDKKDEVGNILFKIRPAATGDREGERDISLEVPGKKSKSAKDA